MAEKRWCVRTSRSDGGSRMIEGSITKITSRNRQERFSLEKGVRVVLAAAQEKIGGPREWMRKRDRNCVGGITKRSVSTALATKVRLLL